MAYVPDIKQPGYAPAWQPKTADRQHEFQTMDGSKYIVYVPSSNQLKAYEKSLKKYKDVFDQIKADIKDDAAIAKNSEGLPNNLDHVEWAALLSSIFKKLDKTWGVNDKIWIRNKNDDGTKYQQPVLAITPKITQRNGKRVTRKVSAAAEAIADDDGYIDPDDIEFGPLINVPVVYVKTKNGLTYNYRTKADVDNDNYFKIENDDRELVNESGKRINPDGSLMKFIHKSDFDQRQARKRSKRAWAEKQIELGNDVWLDDYDTSREPSEGFITEDEAEDEDDNPRDDFDYNDGIPPYPGAVWDDEFRNWVSDPFDMGIYDEDGNYKIPPEDIIAEPAPAPMIASVQPQEKSMREKLKDRMREKALASLPKKPEPIVVMPLPPAPSAEDPRIVEARIGLPPGWEPLISKTKNKVYYFNPKKGNQFERPTMGGKRTRKHPRQRPRPKSRAKKPKRKQTSTRRKRTTTRRK
jgi:hypothetical protein